MKLQDLCSDESRLFVKSEFQPASDRWPALSFSSRKVASDFANEYRRGRDYVIYVGTSDPSTTERPEHRQRLMSVISVEPRTPVSTRDLVPAKVWERAVSEYGVRWEWSLPILAAYDVSGFPRAHDTIPVTYAALGTLPNLGRCVELKDDERMRLLSLDLEPVPLQLSTRAQSIIDLNADDKVANSHAIMTPEGRFRVQFQPLLTSCVSILPFGPMGWEGCWGDDMRGPDRPDTSRLFRAAPADQGDRTDTIGVARDGAQGDPWPRDRVQV